MLRLQSWNTAKHNALGLFNITQRGDGTDVEVISDEEYYTSSLQVFSLFDTRTHMLDLSVMLWMVSESFDETVCYCV